MATGREVECYKGHRSPVRCVAFSPDGKRLASSSGGLLEKGQFRGGGDCTIPDPGFAQVRRGRRVTLSMQDGPGFMVVNIDKVARVGPTRRGRCDE